MCALLTWCNSLCLDNMPENSRQDCRILCCRLGSSCHEQGAAMFWTASSSIFDSGYGYSYAYIFVRDVDILFNILTVGHKLQRWSEADGENRANVHHPETDGIRQNQGQNRPNVIFCHVQWSYDKPDQNYLYPQPFPLVSSSRWLKKRGELAICTEELSIWRAFSHRSYYLFLFNDVLIITKKKRSVELKSLLDFLKKIKVCWITKWPFNVNCSQTSSN